VIGACHLVYAIDHDWARFDPGPSKIRALVSLIETASLAATVAIGLGAFLEYRATGHPAALVAAMIGLLVLATIGPLMSIYLATDDPEDLVWIRTKSQYAVSALRGAALVSL